MWRGSGWLPLDGKSEDFEAPNKSIFIPMALKRAAS